MVADAAGLRTDSPDGWTREFDLEIAVTEPAFWNGVAPLIADTLAFLTTDRWQLRFIPGGAAVPEPARVVRPPQDCVALLSGGLDSLIGTIDLAAAGTRPLVISKIVRGDSKKQREFARAIGGGLRHVQLNESPLTGSRVGSLSTRTAHPQFLALFQDLLDAAGIRVAIRTPYADKTKGECGDRPKLSLARPILSPAQEVESGRLFERKPSPPLRHSGRCENQ